MFRKVAFLLTVLLLVLARSASAAPRDKAAQKKIEEAMYEKFLQTDFDAAEGLLLGTIRACEDKCTPALLAKAWMYVGVVRGSGRQDLAGAEEAFTTALQTDPNVALDNETATDPVKAVFAKVKGGGAKATKTAPFTCKPSPTEIETRRPVPLECESDAEPDKVKLFYKSFDGAWKSVPMQLDGGAFRGTIPCSATQNTGKLRYYVEGVDGDGKVVASFGKQDEANEADVVSETTADPPAYPGEEPPARCGLSDPEPPPPGGGACGSWGAPCGPDGCCESGLSCNAGTCEGKCESDADCKDGATCEDGKCEGGSTGGGKEDKSYPKNLLSLSFGIDIASISSDKACDPSATSEHIHCFLDDGTQYKGQPSAAAAGKISGGFTPSTMRILASYERLVGAIGLEGRVGFAFNGGKTPEGGTAFLPVHLELRGKYWLLGESAFTKPGFRPWVFVGGGLAQVDASVKTQIVDCSDAGDACVNAATPGDAKDAKGRVTSVKATKQLGQGFVSVGGGVMYAVAKNHGVLLNLTFMVPLPSTGFVVQPSLGYSVGF